MPFTPPSSVSPGQSYSASAHNIIVSDLIDLDSRATTLAAVVPPTGSILQYIADAAPTGWLVCDGSQVSQATYSALYAVLGANKFGPDTGGNFYLPDLRGRVPVGKGTNPDVNAIGLNEAGTAAAGVSGVVGDRRPKHKHTASSSDAGHSHGVTSLQGAYTAAGSAPGAFIMGNGNGWNQGLAGLPFSINNGNASITTTVGPQTNVPTDGPAFVVVNFIIKT